MINLLFIHQSGEMYGSDKTLLFLLKYLDKSRFTSVVILPSEGPLKIALENENIKVVIAPVLKLHRKMFSVKEIYNFLNDSKKAVSTMDILHKTHHFDIIYSNTLAVLLGINYARKRKIKHIWHIHEIIESPKLIKHFFLKLIQIKANTKIIYNSFATSKFWNVNSIIARKSVIILNGLESIKEILPEKEIQKIRLDFFNADSNEIVIALIGRINSWKGQAILLEGFVELAKLNTNIKLVFIGSTPPNQDYLVADLHNKIAECNITEKVAIIPFQENIADFWQSIDIAVVPSIEPEPFGLVAVEAMLAKKPVVASNHGGLSEIVVNNETGLLVEPRNVNELIIALQKLIENEELRKSFGQKGYEKAIKEFSVEHYTKKIEGIFDAIL
jgi:glycosyltransferase involved in cell wall biosynthesis